MIRRMLRGGLSGFVATLVMTGVMYAGKWLGFLRTPPPQQITARAGHKANVPPEHVPKGAFDAAWLAAHFGYGASCGALFGLIVPLMPRRASASGLLYGGALWAISYLKLMPKLGLYPPERRLTIADRGYGCGARGLWGDTGEAFRSVAARA